LAQVTRTQKVRLGVFLASGLSVLVGGLVVLAGLSLGESRDRYVVRFRESGVSLSGLDVGSPVKYSGIRVGRVDAVRIDPQDVSVILVELSLDGGTPVAEDSMANLGAQGITGLKYVELSRGSKAARVREPGEEIPPGTSMFDSLAQKADEIAGKVEIVLDRVAILAAPDMKDRLARLLDRSSELLATVNGVLADNRVALKTLAEQVTATAGQVKQLSTELAGAAGRASALLGEATVLVRNSRATPERLNAFLEQGTAVLAESRVLLGQDGLQRALARVNTILAQTEHQVIETVGLMREAAENASVLTEKVRDDPSLLLLGGRDEDAP
jgi:phospholipid/cholesterol/gamma-HCH transport system substrate-binding protein